MTHRNQSQQDASGLIKSLIHPKYTMKIGNWNVRTLYRSGNEGNDKERYDNHREGVGILMSKHAAGSLMEWTPISERVIQARFYSRYIKLTIIHIYAPTEDADEQTKDAFYGKLQDVLDTVNEHDMLIATGDMNAKVGNDNWAYESVMGKHGLGKEMIMEKGFALCVI